MCCMQLALVCPFDAVGATRMGSHQAAWPNAEHSVNEQYTLNVPKSS